MYVLNETEQHGTVGGGMESCLFNCYDYFDGDRRTANDYYVDTLINLSYVPDDYGGVPFSDIGKIGAFGGFTVKEIQSDTAIKPNGLTSDGCQVMMVINKDIYDSTGKYIKTIGHSTVVTGIDRRDGQAGLTCFDPTTGEYDFRVVGDRVALFSVKDTYAPGVTDQTSISISTS